MERKKGFMDDGGGFDRIWDGTIGRLDNAFKHFGKTRLAKLLATVLSAFVVFSILVVADVRVIRGSLGSADLRMLLQQEAGLPEAAGLTEAEYSEFTYDLSNVAYGWFSEKDIEWFQDEFGYNPYSEQETQLLLESNGLFERLDGWLVYSDFWRSIINTIGVIIGIWLIRKKNFRRWLVGMFAGIAAAMLPVAYFAICFTRNFRGTMLYICDALFSVDCRIFSPENSILARLMTESVLRGIYDHILYEIFKGAAASVGFVLVIWLIYYLTDKFSKQEKEDNANEKPEI